MLLSVLVVWWLCILVILNFEFLLLSLGNLGVSVCWIVSCYFGWFVVCLMFGFVLGFWYGWVAAGFGFQVWVLAWLVLLSLDALVLCGFMSL